MDRNAVPREELIAEIRAFMRRAGIEHAIFFGSRERGNARPHSDVNLILLDERFHGQRLSTLLQELQRHWKSDIFPTMLPVSPKEFEEMRAWNALVREAAERGLRLHVDPDEEEPLP